MARKLFMPALSVEVDIDAEGARPVVGSVCSDGLVFSVEGPGRARLVVATPDARADEAILSVPASVGHGSASYSVSSIGPRAFAGCQAETVRLPASVREVDSLAFADCAVQRVEVDPASPFIASFDGVPYDASLTRLLSIPGGRQGAVRIPKTAEEVDLSAFSHCAGVAAFSVDAGSAAYSSWEGCLYDAAGSTLVRVPPAAVDVVIREGCSSVAAGAFAGCTQLGSIQAPASVASVSPLACEPTPVVASPLAAGLSNEGEGPAAGMRLSALVALAAQGDGEPQVDAARIGVLLPEGADASPWAARGFAVGSGSADAQLQGRASASDGGQDQVKELLDLWNLSDKTVYYSMTQSSRPAGDPYLEWPLTATPATPCAYELKPGERLDIDCVSRSGAYPDNTNSDIELGYTAYYGIWVKWFSDLYQTTNCKLYTFSTVKGAAGGRGLCTWLGSDLTLGPPVNEGWHDPAVSGPIRSWILDSIGGQRLDFEVSWSGNGGSWPEGSIKEQAGTSVSPDRMKVVETFSPRPTFVSLGPAGSSATTALPTREGYDFEGWGPAKVASASDVGRAKVDYAHRDWHAQWKPRSYTVQYYASDGKKLLGSSGTQRYGTSFTLMGLPTTGAAPDRVPMGWATEPGSSTARFGFGANDAGGIVPAKDGDVIKLYLAEVDQDVREVVRIHNLSQGKLLTSSVDAPVGEGSVPVAAEALLEPGDAFLWSFAMNQAAGATSSSLQLGNSSGSGSYLLWHWNEAPSEDVAERAQTRFFRATDLAEWTRSVGYVDSQGSPIPERTWSEQELAGQGPLEWYVASIDGKSLAYEVTWHAEGGSWDEGTTWPGSGSSLSSDGEAVVQERLPIPASSQRGPLDAEGVAQTPKREGYRFVGWAPSPDAPSDEVSEAPKVGADSTEWHAQWHVCYDVTAPVGDPASLTFEVDAMTGEVRVASGSSATRLLRSYMPTDSWVAEVRCVGLDELGRPAAQGSAPAVERLFGAGSREHVTFTLGVDGRTLRFRAGDAPMVEGLFAIPAASGLEEPGSIGLSYGLEVGEGVDVPPSHELMPACRFEYTISCLG